jgi:hypothetical protein
MQSRKGEGEKMTDKDFQKDIERVLAETPDIPYRADKRDFKKAMEAKEFKLSVNQVKEYLVLLSLERARTASILLAGKFPKGKKLPKIIRDEYLENLKFCDGEIRSLELLLLGEKEVRL